MGVQRAILVAVAKADLFIVSAGNALQRALPGLLTALIVFVALMRLGSGRSK